MPEDNQEFYPTSEEEVLQAVEWALATGTALEVLGTGTKQAIGCGVNAGARLHLSHLTGILSYEPEELVISAWAGTPLSEIEAILAAEGQHLAFEPPDYSTLLGAVGKGTLGGAIASGFAGPRRIVAGAARDHVLGVTGITGRGELFKIGGRVVKNVTGYDLSKLLAGSFGTLAIMTRITLKVLPRPETTRTLGISGRSRNDALELLRKGAASPFGMTGAALTPDGSANLRLEGREDEIDVRARKVCDYLDAEMMCSGGETSRSLWTGVRDLSGWADKSVIWRINLPRASAAQLASRLEAQTGGEMMFDWAGARVWLALPEGGPHGTIREICAASGGKTMLFKAPKELKADIPVFHPELPALASLSSRVRDAFDPQRILNPGRMGLAEIDGK